MRRSMLAVAALTLAALLALQAGEAFARAGSGGSRGSRSSSAPAQPTSPSSPSRSLSTPASPASPAPPPSRGGWFGPIMGGLAGFALGGLLGSMLFGGGFGGGIGLLEILLIGAGLFLLFRFMSARRQQQPAYATAGAPYAGGGAYAGGSAYGGAAPQETATPEAPAVASDLDRGLGHIRSMDPTFDPGFVADAARGLFGDVQRAVTARDMSPVSGRLTSRMYTELTGQCDRLRAARQTNRMEAMNLRTAEVTEAWQESGQDFVTVYLAGSLVDYTVDDATGAVVAGAKAPQEFEEFWTFTRAVGPNPWRLSAIQSS
jgi:predicted lipid-binding transport protein (Tim44 family)